MATALSSARGSQNRSVQAGSNDLNVSLICFRLMSGDRNVWLKSHLCQKLGGYLISSITCSQNRNFLRLQNGYLQANLCVFKHIIRENVVCPM